MNAAEGNFSRFFFTPPMDAFGLLDNHTILSRTMSYAAVGPLLIHGYEAPEKRMQTKRYDRRYGRRMEISTRLFAARPCGVLLLATGLRAPKPDARRRDRAMP